MLNKYDPTKYIEIITPDFLQLDRLLKGFNIFNATDMRRREIKHTKFLAHLLDPHESHGLGIRFLENFIININNQNIKKIDFLSLDLMNAVVSSEEKLEKRAIDLLIRIPSSTESLRPILIAIEVKVDSIESELQLEKYRKFHGLH